MAAAQTQQHDQVGILRHFPEVALLFTEREIQIEDRFIQPHGRQIPRWFEVAENKPNTRVFQINRPIFIAALQNHQTDNRNFESIDAIIIFVLLSESEQEFYINYFKKIGNHQLSRNLETLTRREARVQAEREEAILNGRP